MLCKERHKEERLKHSEEDLLALVKAFLDAWNAHDLEAIMAFFTDDVVYRIGPSPALPDSVIATGKQQVQSHVRPQLPGFHVEAWDYRVSQNTVTFRFRYSEDYFRERGIDSLDGALEVIFEGDKIREVTVTFSPETRDKLMVNLVEEHPP